MHPIGRLVLAVILSALFLLRQQPQPAQAAVIVTPASTGYYTKNASTVNVLAAYNVASIQDQGTGTVQVRFQRPMATDKYVVVVSAENTPVAWAWNRSPTGFWISTGMDRTVDFVVYGIQ